MHRSRPAINLRSISHLPPLSRLAPQGHTSVAALLDSTRRRGRHKHKRKHRDRVLAWAGQGLAALEALIAAGADTDAATGDNAAAARVAATAGQAESATALHAAGGHTDAVMKDGTTPLHVAAAMGHLESLKALLAAGADKDAVMEGGITPLYIAAQEGHAESVEALLAAGAVKNARACWCAWCLSVREGTSGCKPASPPRPTPRPYPAPCHSSLAGHPPL